MSEAQGPGTGRDGSSSEVLLMRWASMVPVPPRRPPSRRRGRLRAALALLVVVGLALATVTTVRLLSRDATAHGTDDAPRSAPTAPTPMPTTQPTLGNTTAADRVPGRTAPGVHVQVVPRDDGSLNVVESVRFLGSSTGLGLAPPSMVGILRSALPLGVRIADLQVFADGSRVQVHRDSLTTGGRLLLPSAPRAVELRYRLVGSAIKSTPSTPGRALIVLPPIAADDSLSNLSVVVEISSRHVRNLVCPGLPDSDQLCGRQTPTGWRTVSLPPRATAVLAQLDLPVA